MSSSEVQSRLSLNLTKSNQMNQTSGSGFDMDKTNAMKQPYLADIFKPKTRQAGRRIELNYDSPIQKSKNKNHFSQRNMRS